MGLVAIGTTLAVTSGLKALSGWEQQQHTGSQGLCGLVGSNLSLLVNWLQHLKYKGADTWFLLASTPILSSTVGLWKAEVLAPVWPGRLAMHWPFRVC